MLVFFAPRGHAGAARARPASSSLTQRSLRQPSSTVRVVLRSALLTPLLLLAACTDEAPATGEPTSRPVKLFSVDAGVGDEIRRFPATIEASKQAELAFRVSGQLAELPVREGEIVSEGQEIARLDTTDFEITVEDREAAFENARRNFERARDLIESGSISRLDYDRMETEFRSSRAALSQAEANLGYATLRAPFRGRIARRFIDNFEEVVGGQPIVYLQDTEVLFVSIEMPEALVRSVTAGRDGAMPDTSALDDEAAEVRAMASFEDYPDISYTLEINEIATRADPDTQTFSVTFRMPQPEEFTVLPGMTAQVDIDFSRLLVRETATWVPADAVHADAGLDPRVFVLDGDAMLVRGRPVTVGRLSGDMIEVLSGLSGGEEIVAVGAAYLSDGMRVTRFDSGEQAIPREGDEARTPGA